MAWGGMLFQIVKSEDARETYSRILGYVFLGSLSIAMVLSAFAPMLVKVFTTSAYSAAIPILPLLFLVRAVSILEYPGSTGIYLRGRTGWFAAIYSAGLVVTVTLSKIFVPVYGMYGVAWSWLAGWVVLTGFMLLVSQKYYPLRMELKFFALPVVCWVLLLAGQQGYLGTILQFSWTAKIGLAAGILFGGLAICVRDLRSVGREVAAE
jgi:O-antigen/teichoic acid export membrane protein